MSLEENTAVDLIEILMTGPLQVRKATIITRDGEPVGPPTYYRYVLEPGADLAGQPPEVAALANAHWSAARVAAWQAIRQDAAQ